jgi:hypothetical protein
VHGLISVLTSLLIGQVDRASNRLTTRPWWRVPITLIIVAASAWVAFASAYLWTTSARPGVVGLLAFVRAGGPAWVLAAPALALATVFAAVLPAAGRYGLVLLFQAGTFALTLAALATFAPGTTTTNGPAISSFLVTLPAMLLAIVTALGDVAPLDSPLIYGNMTYWGRIGFLRALSHSARRLGWDLTTPSSSGKIYTTGGYLGGRREAQVVSGYTMQSSTLTGAGAGYWIKVQVNVLRPIPGATIKRQMRPLEPSIHAATGTVAGGLVPLRFTVMTSRPPSADWLNRYSQQIARGGAYLRSAQAAVRVVRGGLMYSSFSPFRMARRYGEIEPLAEWLTGLAALLEELAPDAPAEPPAPLDRQPPTR